MHKLILIERPNNWWPNLIKGKKKEELSIEKIINKYQGFEGELIDFFQINEHENENKLKKIIDSYLEIKKLGNCFVLYVTSGFQKIPNLLKERIIFIGYDVGICEVETTMYSSILQEILVWRINELIDYKDVLNENLLFQDRLAAEKYVDFHNKLSIQGKNVEDYFEMIIYEIWKVE